MQFDKKKLKIAGIVVGVIVVILIALPLFININSFKPKIESELSNALGRPVSLGDLSLSILSGSVTVKNVSIADDPAFSQSPFITAKSLKVGVELMPLIFSKKLNITGIELDEPQITLLKAGTKWNFSTLGGASAKAAPDAEKSSGAQNLSVDKLEVKDGKLAVGNANSKAKPQVYENVNVEVTNFSAKSQFPFELTTDLPGGGSAKLSGKAGPINASDSAKTPLTAEIKVKNLDLAASGFVDPASGIGGVADFEGTLNSDGKQAKATGNVDLEKVKLSPKGTPASKSVTVKYAVDSNLDTDAGTITQGDIAIGKVAARLTGGFQSQGDSKILNMKLSAPDMSVDEIEAFLPAMGVTLPSGSKLKGGTLSADLSISGPLDKLVIAGPVRLSNTKLDGFDMGAKLGALSAFGGRGSSGGGGDTTIQNASLSARIAPEMTRADSINVTIPSLGVVTGAGTVSPSGALDFRMTADLQGARSDVRTERRGHETGAVPFTIQGTTSNPSFGADVGGMAGSAIKGAVGGKIPGKESSNPVSSITGVFGRKKK
jgi:AsmA protein